MISEENGQLWWGSLMLPHRCALGNWGTCDIPHMKIHLTRSWILTGNKVVFTPAFCRASLCKPQAILPGMHGLDWQPPDILTALPFSSAYFFQTLPQKQILDSGKPVSDWTWQKAGALELAFWGCEEVQGRTSCSSLHAPSLHASYGESFADIPTHIRNHEGSGMFDKIMCRRF